MLLPILWLSGFELRDFFGAQRVQGKSVKVVKRCLTWLVQAC